ncbi:MAG: transglutaminase domain-containing protein [Pseudomonadota bacterium]|nr:transglutaminase domain-containing protein [Pseudomonadota bacterium]
MKAHSAKAPRSRFDRHPKFAMRRRAANVPARYVYGTIKAPLPQVQNWVGGTTNANATLDVLSRGGIPAVGVTEARIVRRVKWEHVWVEAFLDYVPSRGERPRAGDTWIPMDPSFKQYTFTGGMDLATNVAFDAQTLLDQAQQGATVNETEGWVQNLNQAAVQTGIEDYRSRLTDFVTTANPDATVGDVLGTQKILPEALPYLPSTLPNRVVAIAQRWAELPTTLRWQFAFETDGTTLVNRSLPELAGKRMALSFTPATPADEETLASVLSCVKCRI